MQNNFRDKVVDIINRENDLIDKYTTLKSLESNINGFRDIINSILMDKKEHVKTIEHVFDEVFIDGKEV